MTSEKDIKKIFLEELKNSNLLGKKLELKFEKNIDIEDSIEINLKLFNIEGKQINENDKLKIIIYKKQKTGKILALWDKMKLKNEFKNTEMIDELNNYMIRILNRFNKRKNNV